MAQYLLDTNVLVYCFDGAEHEKQARALVVVARVGRPGPAGLTATLPAQALAEFARVVTGRLRPPLPADEVYRQVELYERVFPVVALTSAVVLEAVRGLRDYGFSYYDAQIWAVAKLNQVSVVLSEDVASGSTVEGIAYRGPGNGGHILMLNARDLRLKDALLCSIVDDSGAETLRRYFAQLQYTASYCVRMPRADTDIEGVIPEIGGNVATAKKASKAASHALGQDE